MSSTPGATVAVHVDEAIDPDVSSRLEAVKPWLGGKLHDVLKLLAIERGQLSIALVNDQVMSRLHESYAGVSGTTDVLTFDLRDDGDGEDQAALDGEIVACVDEAARQSARRGHKLEEELLLYAIHGLLHLLGEDDHDPEDAQRMHAREDELLERLGLGPIYARDAGEDDS
ncbi:MAG: rRNA maturation RNase YbeY [Phycisphaeraceae bacterium]|nr:rRNA maturation RNase YbeY [Phycisphaeraceae bacterium]